MKLRIAQAHTERVWLARGLVSTFIRSLPLVACFSLAISTRATVLTADLPNLDSLPNFAEFANQQVDDLATVNGTVGVSFGGMLDLTKPATINGNLDLNTTAKLTQDGVITGATLNNQNLSTEESDFISAAAALAALTPDETLTAGQTAALSFNVPAGQVEVVDLVGGLDLNYQNVTLTGGGDLVLNIDKSFTLDGSASIVGNPSNIFINYEGTTPITTHVADTIDGLVFDADGGGNLDGTWNGSIFGGTGTITLNSGTFINGITPVPEPGPMVLILMGFAALLLHHARRSIAA